MAWSPLLLSPTPPLIFRGGGTYKPIDAVYQYCMATVEESVTGPRFARKLAEAGFSDFLILDREAAEKVLTEKRMELVETIREQEPASIHELARLVDRDPAAVHRDLQILRENMVIDVEEGEGGRKKPVIRRSHIFIEPVF